jgi:hypothetical protein
MLGLDGASSLSVGASQRRAGGLGFTTRALLSTAGSHVPTNLGVVRQQVVAWPGQRFLMTTDDRTSCVNQGLPER